MKVFIHGLESSTLGTKAVYFSKRYPDMMIRNYRGDLRKRMKKLERLVAAKADLRVVGSSFGGLMATLFALENESRITKLILLAPAINHLDTNEIEGRKISIPTWIYHGRNDEVIPLKSVRPIADKLFTNLSFHAVDDDHFLHKTFKSLNWDELLS
jgi:pimeloyl-ACP methyl ester carboxylesterase